MIFLMNNETNAVCVIISKNINRCDDYLFEFVNESSKLKTYLYTTNLSNSIAKYDLFEIIEDQTAPLKDYYNNEPVNLKKGQYTTFIYTIDNIPNDMNDIENIINSNNKVFATKMIVNIENELVTPIKNKYL